MAVPMNDGGFAVVDERDFKLVRDRTWYLHPAGYAQAYVKSRHYNKRGTGRKKYRSDLMHRVIVAAPAGKVVDHLNGDKLDNRRENLRVCSQMDNMRNPNNKRQGRPRKEPSCQAW